MNSNAIQSSPNLMELLLSKKYWSSRVYTQLRGLGLSAPDRPESPSSKLEFITRISQMENSTEPRSAYGYFLEPDEKLFSQDEGDEKDECGGFCDSDFA